MSVHSFQSFISSDEQLLSFGSCITQVDLLSLNEEGGRGNYNRGRGYHGHAHKSRVALVVDAENCLDRLYGGYFSGNYEKLRNYIHGLTFAC